MSIRTLCRSLEKKAELELNEVPTRVATDILAIREWLKKQPHLKSVNPTDQWIIGYLRGNKYSLERCKEKLDMYYTLRTVVPEIFRDRDPLDPLIQSVLKSGCLLPLKTCKKEDSCRVVLVQFKESSAKHQLINMLKIMFMIVEVLILEDDNFIIAGEEALVDLKDIGLSIFTQWTPALAKKVLTSMEKALPVRLKSCHVMYTPPGFEAAYSLLRNCIGDKFKQRFFIYPKLNDAIYNVIPRNILPQEYGGENSTVQELIEHWKTKVESYRDWFLEQDKQHSDESLRPEDPKTSSTLFGVEGSFRKLEVD